MFKNKRLLKHLNILFITSLILITFFYLFFALRTNFFFSLDDFAVLSYFKNHSTFEMIGQFSTEGDIWGFRKIIGYLNLKAIYHFFNTNQFVYLINNHLIHTANIILLYLIVKRLTKHVYKAFFLSVITSQFYLYYISNIHEYLVTFFVLSSVYLFIQNSYLDKGANKKSLFYPLSLIAFIFALFTKELGFITPFILFSLNLTKNSLIESVKKITPFVLIAFLYLLYQLSFASLKLILPQNHPYAINFSLSHIWFNLFSYLPWWFVLASIVGVVVKRRLSTLLLFLTGLLSLAPALILANRVERYYLYLPAFVFVLFLSRVLPRMSLKTTPVYLFVLLLYGGRQALPPLAKQNYPNWQKVSIDNVLKKVQTDISKNPQLSGVDVSKIHLERDAKLMLGSNVIDLFLSSDLSDRYQFRYNSDNKSILVLTK